MSFVRFCNGNGGGLGPLEDVYEESLLITDSFVESSRKWEINREENKKFKLELEKRYKEYEQGTYLTDDLTNSFEYLKKEPSTDFVCKCEPHEALAIKCLSELIDVVESIALMYGGLDDDVCDALPTTIEFEKNGAKKTIHVWWNELPSCYCEDVQKVIVKLVPNGFYIPQFLKVSKRRNK